MMRKALLVFSLLLSLAVASAHPPETTEALDIGSCHWSRKAGVVKLPSAVAETAASGPLRALTRSE